MRWFEVSALRGRAPSGRADAATRHHGGLRLPRRVCALAALVALAAAPGARADAARELPEFTHPAATDWINSAPLASATLRGHPVLLEVWTFECSNCLASLKWMQRIASAYQGRGLVIVGVHTPELPAERDRAGVAAAVRRLDIRYPVMLDADYSYWRALGNHYWPAFYLYDETGRLLATRIGELHAGEAGADTFERLLASRLPATAGAQR
jgi:thiol-disulfide isomerase/thioredoxin